MRSPLLYQVACFYYSKWIDNVLPASSSQMLGFALVQMSSVLSGFFVPALSGSQTPKSLSWVFWWELAASWQLPVCQLLVVVLFNYHFLFMISCELQTNTVYICSTLVQEGTAGSNCRQRDRDFRENTHFLGVDVTLVLKPPATSVWALTSLLFCWRH